MIILCPMYVQVGRKKISMNLNQYRNMHHQISNKAKIAFKQAVFPMFKGMASMDKIRIVYTMYPHTKRFYDVSNVCSIVDKFFCDSLVVAGKLPDDNHNHVVSVEYRFGGINRTGGGYVLAEITEVV
jgi:hypothetical protein